MDEAQNTDDLLAGHDITLLIQAAREGDEQANNQLYTLLYPILHRIAGFRRHKWSGDYTPTCRLAGVLSLTSPQVCVPIGAMPVPSGIAVGEDIRLYLRCVTTPTVPSRPKSVRVFEKARNGVGTPAQRRR